MQTLFDNAFETVNFYEDLSLFEAIWKAESANMEDIDYQNEIKTQFAFIATKKIRNILFDTCHFYFVIGVETQEWNNEILTKNFLEAGVKKVAVVLSPDIFSQVSVQQTIEEYKNVSFQTKYFKSNEDAKAWLAEEK